MAMRTRFITLAACGVVLFTPFETLAKQSFNSSQLDGKGSELIFSDLDGDGLKDAVLVEGLNLSIYYQDANQGFPGKPQQRHAFDGGPGLLSWAKFGDTQAALLLMNSAGVWEVDFSKRTSLAERKQIIKRQTILPEKVEEQRVVSLPFCAKSKGLETLLLLPVQNGLEIWRRRNEWEKSQVIEGGVDSHLEPSISNPGYTRTFELSFSIDDINGDGRDDLMCRQTGHTNAQTYNLYLQKADGLFDLKPVTSFTARSDSKSAFYWTDVNRDGRVDLIKGMFLAEPSLIPGLLSGKGIVGIYLADKGGTIPGSPQQVFRKNDWSPALPVLDLDGDGFVDLALAQIPLNTREGVRKMATAKQLDFSLQFYFYRPPSGFPRDPDFLRDFVVHFDRELLLNPDRGVDPAMFFNLEGDYNGDGKRDLLLRDRGKAISLYFFDPATRRFRKDPDLRLECPDPMDGFEVDDLNGDKLSDVAVKLSKKESFRIFLSRK